MHRRIAALAAAILVIPVLAGCDPAAPEPDPTSAVGTASAAETAPAGTEQVLDEFGLTFALPEGFETYDGGMAFSAQRANPQGFLTIDPMQGGAPPYDTYPAREGETLEILTLGEVEVLVIKGAALSGLPTGVSANELVVDNGDASFSVVLSSEADALDDAWSTFLDSVVIAPAG